MRGRRARAAYVLAPTATERYSCATTATPRAKGLGPAPGSRGPNPSRSSPISSVGERLGVRPLQPLAPRASRLAALLHRTTRIGCEPAWLRLRPGRATAGRLALVKASPATSCLSLCARTPITIMYARPFVEHHSTGRITGGHENRAGPMSGSSAAHDLHLFLWGRQPLFGVVRPPDSQVASGHLKFSPAI
jgi:hypothetical protein